MPLSDEQKAFGAAVIQGTPVSKGNAGAGTGKTTVLKEIASTAKRKQRKRILYTAFNRSMADAAAERFGDTADCNTPHGLAYKAMKVGRWGADKLKQKAFPTEVAKIMGIRGISGLGSAYETTQVVQQTVEAFCQTADAAIGPQHARMAGVPPTPDLTSFVVEHACRLWDAMSDASNTMAMTHNTYLKMWQLAGPTLKYDLILFDEAQDANPVMMDIVRRQKAQQAWVGDRFQEIYGWNGAINAMREIEGPQFNLTQSWRFTPEIADAANGILALGEDVPDFLLKGTENPREIPGHVRIARTNSRLFDEALKVVDKGKSFAVIGGLRTVLHLVRSAHSLKYGTGYPKAPEVSRFKSFRDMEDWAERFDDREIKFLVRTLRRYGQDIPKLCHKLEINEVSEEFAKVILSTGHRVKGREFATATLLDDFILPGDKGWEKLSARERQAEINLLYVSATRGALLLKMPENILATIASLHEIGTVPAPVRAEPAPAPMRGFAAMC